MQQSDSWVSAVVEPGTGSGRLLLAGSSGHLYTHDLITNKVTAQVSSGSLTRSCTASETTAVCNTKKSVTCCSRSHAAAGDSADAVFELPPVTELCCTLALLKSILHEPVCSLLLSEGEALLCTYLFEWCPHFRKVVLLLLMV